MAYDSNTFPMGQLVPMIITEAMRQGVDPNIALSHFYAENTSDGKLAPDKGVSLTTQGIDPATGKPSGALGLFQVVGSTLAGLKKNGTIPPDTDYATLAGQITAGVGAVKDAHAQDNGDPFRGAAMYANGAQGMAAYDAAKSGVPGVVMPAQLTGYLPKFKQGMGTAGPGTPGVNTPTPPGMTGGMSYRTKSADPGLQGAMVQATQQFNGIADNNLQMLQAMGVQSATAGEQLKGGIDAKTTAEAAGATAAASREMDLNNRDTKLLDAFNLNPDNPGNMLVDSMDKMTMASQTADHLKPQVDQLMAVNPLTDPVAWVAAQFQLSSLVPQYNAAIQNRDRASGELAVRQQLDSQQKSLTPASTIETIQNERAAKIAMSQAQGTIDKAKIDQDMISTKVRYLNEELSVAGTKAQLSMSQNRMMLDTWGYHQEDGAKADQQKMLDNANMILLGLGQAPLTGVTMLKGLNKDDQEFLTLSNPQAMDPGKALAFIARSGGQATLRAKSPVMAGVVSQMMQDGGNVAAASYPAWKSQGMSDKQMQEKAFNQVYNNYRDVIATGDMTRAAPDNPYRMKPIIYATAPGLEDNSIAKFVVQNKNLPVLGEREIMANAVSQVNSGRSPRDVANDVTQFVSLGMRNQNRQMGLATLGFDPATQTVRGGKKITPEVSYGINSDIFAPNLFSQISGLAGFSSLPFAGQTGGKANVQLMNPVSVENFLTEQSIKSKNLSEMTLTPTSP